MTGTLLTDDPWRLATAVLVVLAYAVLCAYLQRTHARRQAQQRQAASSLRHAAPNEKPLLIAYASQTGSAERIAWQTAQTLHAAGLACEVLPLMQLDANKLQSSDHLLCVASTYGEGDAPDNAALFVQRLMSQTQNLGHLQCSLLALGDRTYRNFCGFGVALKQWLIQQGGQVATYIEADRLDETALRDWRQQLSHLSGIHDLPVWQEQPFEAWRLQKRMLVNTGSAGQPCFHLELSPVAGELPDWQAGDLVQVRTPGEQQPREYSIASLPTEGSVHLLVRQSRRTDGTLGLASGWLTQQLPVGEEIELRLRPHPAFHIDANAQRPLILIGNGTGIAGLRAHLRQRIASQRTWLIFGERNANHDFFYGDELREHLNAGELERLDLAFSRDQPQSRYVQHVLQEQGSLLLTWLAADAAIYVCGSLQGMATAVHDELLKLVGEAQLSSLIEQGRYRRDVY